MKQSRFTESQIINILKQAEAEAGALHLLYAHQF